MGLIVVSLISVLLGLILGFIGTIGGVYIYAGKRIKNNKLKVEDLLKEVGLQSKSASLVKDRLNKVQDIIDEQQSLRSQADHPQQNSLDGKFKNGLIHKMRALEEEKTDILQSILKEGHDPLIGVLDSVTGQVDKIKLSEFMAKSEIPTAVPVQKTNSNIRQVGKFTVISNNNQSDDDDDGKIN